MPPHLFGYWFHLTFLRWWFPLNHTQPPGIPSSFPVIPGCFKASFPSFLGILCRKGKPMDAWAWACHLDLVCLATLSFLEFSRILISLPVLLWISKVMLQLWGEGRGKYMCSVDHLQLELLFSLCLENGSSFVRFARVSAFCARLARTGSSGAGRP